MPAAALPARNMRSRSARRSSPAVVMPMAAAIGPSVQALFSQTPPIPRLPLPRRRPENLANARACVLTIDGVTVPCEFVSHHGRLSILCLAGIEFHSSRQIAEIGTHGTIQQIAERAYRLLPAGTPLVILVPTEGLRSSRWPWKHTTKTTPQPGKPNPPTP
jgi:hypothetical protein